LLILSATQENAVVVATASGAAVPVTTISIDTACLLRARLTDIVVADVAATVPWDTYICGEGYLATDGGRRA